jgi:hypothetical protein
MNPQQTEQPEADEPLSRTPDASFGQESPAAVDSTAPSVEDERDDDEGDDGLIVAWEASESVHHEKDMMWFVMIIVAGVLLSAVSIFLIKSITFTVLIVVMVVALIVLARRPPRLLHYELHEQGLMIDQKAYSFREFKAFGVVREGPFYYIVILPVKRFMPSIDVYFPEEYGEDIVDFFFSHITIQKIK